MKENASPLAIEKLDCEGFFSDSEFWSTEAAEHLAKANSITDNGLSDDHWKAIDFVRAYYHQHGTGPAFVQVVKHTGFAMDKICDLFPCGLVKGAYRLAGLPRPPGCV